MANKIGELLSNIRSGARSNKYRVLIPTNDNNLSRNMDILCNASNIPGRAITPIDITIKGKKTQIAGETSLEGTWSATFYNTNSMGIRIYFDNWIQDIHNLNVPEIQNNGLLGLEALNTAVRDVNSAINSFQRNVDRVSGVIKDPLGTLFGSGNVTPFYQRDITIQQLGTSDDDVPFDVTLLGAFPLSISSTEVSDNGEGISETEVTFAYSDIIINQQHPSKTQTIITGLFGDNVGDLF